MIGIVFIIKNYDSIEVKLTEGFLIRIPSIVLAQNKFYSII
jgi:hypothetical protein